MEVYVIMTECRNSIFDVGISIKGIFSSKDTPEEICDNLNRETEAYLKKCEEIRELPGITYHYSVKEYEVE